MNTRQTDPLLDHRPFVVSSRRLLVLICWGSVFLFCAYSVQYSQRLTHGFAAYYGFARMLLEGKFGPSVYDFRLFNQTLHHYGFETVLDAPNNLPTNAFAFLPLAPFSPRAAKILWTALSLAFYGFSIAALLKVNAIPWRSDLGIAVCSLSFLWRPSYENIAFGQLYLALLFLFSLSLLGLVRNRPALASLPIALALVLKGYGIFNALWFLFRKKYLGLVFIMALFLLFAAASIFLVGIETWSTYFGKVFVTLSSDPKGGHVTYQTLSGFFLHFFTYNPTWSPAPILILSPTIASLLAFVITLLIFSFIFFLGNWKGARHENLTFSSLLAASVITVPFAAEYHYVLLLPLVFSCLKHCFPPGKERIRVGPLEGCVFLAIILLALPLRYKFLHGADLPWNLFGYPKLFAGSILIAVSLFVLARSTNTGAEQISEVPERDHGRGPNPY